MKDNFGSILQKLMQEKRLSGRKLAKELGIPYKTLNEWTGPGARIPRDPQLIKKIANYFECSIHFLLFGEEDPRSLMEDLLDKTEIHTGIYEISIKRVNKSGEKK